MKASPGGQLGPQEVVGRDVLITRIWDLLARQSVVLSSERRMGKTQMLRKMQAEAETGFHPIFRDVEDIRTTLQFVNSVYAEVRDLLTRKQKSMQQWRRFWERIQGSEVGDITLSADLAPHWKGALRSLMEDLMAHQEDTVVFFWDEFPHMLLNIMEAEGEPQAMELLDVLRQLRQPASGQAPRMVLTGSIGLHHVISRLKASGYSNEPLNDLRTLTLPPLAQSDALQLAFALLDGEQIETADPEEVASHLARAVDGVAFYIHHVIDALKFTPEPVTIEVVDHLVEQALLDPQDAWHLAHYRDRLDTYYGDADGALALIILDLVAEAAPLSFADLFNRLKSERPLGDNEQEPVRTLVRKLERDHYLRRLPDGYTFQFPLIRRWWILTRM